MNIEDLRQKTLEQTQYWKMLQETLDGIYRALNSKYGDDTRKTGGVYKKQLDDAINIVRASLVQKELDAYRGYFMFAAIGNNKEARKIALERFLADDMSVMQYTTEDGKLLSHYLAVDEEEVRKVIDKIKEMS